MSSETLRIYDPAECDKNGVPLDWDRCRTCGESGRVTPLDEADGPLPFGEVYRDTYEAIVRDDAQALGDAPPSSEVMREQRATCLTCGGHGSLKAAALHFLSYAQWNAVDLAWASGPLFVERPTRCEDCGHPMSEGTWEDPPIASDLGYMETRARGELAVRNGVTWQAVSVHYSPCDEGCRHSGPGRWFDNDFGDWHVGDDVRWQPRFHVADASWRPVDVRTLGWPHDLRPEKLAVLCLRCWAERSR